MGLVKIRITGRKERKNDLSIVRLAPVGAVRNFRGCDILGVFLEKYGCTSAGIVYRFCASAK